MAEYIEREAAYELARTDENYSDFRRSMADLTSLRELLEDTPAADVVEVRHGEWIHTDMALFWHSKDKCSECHYHDPQYIDLSYYNYCPNCGADMRGGKNGNE